MASVFSFPEMNPADIVQSLLGYGITPDPSLRAENIVTPQPGLVADVLARFLSYIGDDEPDEQLAFPALDLHDCPEYHALAIPLAHVYRRANAFLHSINFQDLTLRDLVRADGHRVIYILSAIINFLHYRENKVNSLGSSTLKHYEYWQREAELRTKLDELRKANEEHLLKKQMDVPVVKQLEEEVNALRQRLHKYNEEQLSLRLQSREMDEKRQEIIAEIQQVDFKSVKFMQQKKLYQSKLFIPLKRSRTLEEKKAVRDELKTLEKMAMQNVQEKTSTLETYTKVSEKLVKHLSKMSAIHEKSASAKDSEKDVKAQKEKIDDQNLEIKALRNKAAEWQLKVLENEGILNTKKKERGQRVVENNRKMTSLKSEVESEHSCLEEKEKIIKEKLQKGYELCSLADSVAEAGSKKIQEIYEKYSQVCKASLRYVEDADHSFDQIDEAAEILITVAQT